MLKILIARSIFCPDYDHLHTCCSNLVNLFFKIKFQKNEPNNEKHYTLYLCGWVKKEFLVEIKNTISILSTDNIFVDIIYDLWALNYGKYKILNNIQNICKEYDRIFYSDHDIIFILQINNLFTILENIINYKIDNYSVGIIMLNQLEDIRHQRDIYENEIEHNSTKYIFPTIGNFTSIASGCFYIDSKTFMKIGMSDIKTVYGLDDYYITKRLYDIFILAVVTKDIFVKHPFTENVKYNEWKTNNIKIMMNYTLNESFNENTYYENIEQSMNIWI